MKVNALQFIAGTAVLSAGVGFYDWRAGLIAFGGLIVIEYLLTVRVLR